MSYRFSFEYTLDDSWDFTVYIEHVFHKEVNNFLFILGIVLL